MHLIFYNIDRPFDKRFFDMYFVGNRTVRLSRIRRKVIDPRARSKRERKVRVRNEKFTSLKDNIGRNCRLCDVNTPYREIVSRFKSERVRFYSGDTRCTSKDQMVFFLFWNYVIRSWNSIEEKNVNHFCGTVSGTACPLYCGCHGSTISLVLFLPSFCWFQFLLTVC